MKSTQWPKTIPRVFLLHTRGRTIPKEISSCQNSCLIWKTFQLSKKVWWESRILKKQNKGKTVLKLHRLDFRSSEVLIDWQLGTPQTWCLNILIILFKNLVTQKKQSKWLLYFTRSRVYLLVLIYKLYSSPFVYFSWSNYFLFPNSHILLKKLLPILLSKASLVLFPQNRFQ